MDCIREETFLVLQCLFNSESGQVRREFSSFSFRRARSHSITSHPPPICAICSQSTPHIPSTHPPLPLTSSLYLFTPPFPFPVFLSSRFRNSSRLHIRLPPLPYSPRTSSLSLFLFFSSFPFSIFFLFLSFSSFLW